MAGKLSNPEELRLRALSYRRWVVDEEDPARRDLYFAVANELDALADVIQAVAQPPHLSGER